MKELLIIKKYIDNHYGDLRYLSKIGFRLQDVKHNNSNLKWFWLNKKEKIIVKNPSLIDDCWPENFTVPTVETQDENNDIVFIQPLVNTKNKRRALSILIDKNFKLDDLHVDNVGWYKGKPVVFDW